MKLGKISILILASMTTHSYALTTLPNHDLNLLAKAKLVKAVAPDKEISFVVWLKLRNEEKLTKLAQEVYDVKSPRYHQFLTRAQFEHEFAPNKSAENSVQKFFAAAGMKSTIVNHNIHVSGTIAQIERTLHVKINDYQYRDAIFYSNATAPKVSEEIAPYIAEITGLQITPQMKNNPITPKHNDNPRPLKFSFKNFTPYALPTDISLQGFSGANLQKTYGLGNIAPINGTRIDGSGQTLVIVDKCGTNGPDSIISDANHYFTSNGITTFKPTGPLKNFAVTNPDGTRFTSCPNPSGFSQEIVLDVESSHTIAPGDNTVLVLGDDQKTVLMEVIHTLINNAFTIDGFSNAYVISNSWSSPESGGADTTLETRLALAAASGISVNFSSGDCGDNTYYTQVKCNGSPLSPPTVDYPSSSAFVTAVGATAVFVDSNYRYAFETVWGTVRSLAYDGGTGGGISQFYGPVAWQNSISSFSAGGYGLISSSLNRRALPDVAMLGDPQTGLLIYSNGSQVQDGGTSLACPLFSATLVLVNQARGLLNKGTPIGHAAPYLYQMNQTLLTQHALRLIVPPSVIISGALPPPSGVIQNNTAPASAFTIRNATFGWDSSLTVEPEKQFWNDAVGVGSPNIPNFVSTMANF